MTCTRSPATYGSPQTMISKTDQICKAIWISGADQGLDSQNIHPNSLPLQFLCAKMVEKGAKDSIFSHTFLTLSWKIHSKNPHRDHILWGTNSVKIRFAHTNADVEGGDQAQLHHVFANPYNLDICAVTALANTLLHLSQRRMECFLCKFLLVLSKTIGKTCRIDGILVLIQSGKVLQHTPVV